MPRPLTVLLVIALLLGAGCGDDDGGDVRSGSASASGSGSGASASGSAVEAACNPVGTELEDETIETVEVRLLDFAFEPRSITVPAGVVTFAVTNDGGQPHELAFLPGGAEVPVTDDGAPDEDALAEAGAFELEAFPAGTSCNATYDLEPGRYTLFCVEAEDGETHLATGMDGELAVERS